jgi:hypothetical protein
MTAFGGLAPHPASFSAEHCLTLTVTVTQQFVGQVPGGYRTDLFYSGEREEHGRGQAPIACVSPGAFPAELRSALDAGRILSGNDWATISTRGVLDIESRLTLALRPSEELECPVAGRLRGRAQLGDTLRADGSRLFDVGTSPEKVLAVWQQGFEESSLLPLVLSASFDVPIQGYSREQTRIYQQARALGDSLFLALGKAVFRKAPHGEIKSISLDLHKLRAAAVSA